MRNFLKFLTSREFLIQLGLAVVVCVLLVFAVLQWLKSTTHHGDFVQVPDLAKLSVTEMREVLAAADLRTREPARRDGACS